MTSLQRLALLAMLIVLSVLATPARAADAEIPQTPAGELLEWFVELVAQPTEEHVAKRLGDTLNDTPSPPAAQMFKDFKRIKSITDGLDIVKIKEIDDFELDVLLRGGDKRSWWIATLAASPTPPYRVMTLKLTPLLDEPTGSANEWGDVNWALGNRALPPKVSIRAERDSERGNKPIVRLYEDKRAAIGPASKLFPITAFAELAAQDPGFLAKSVPLKRDLKSMISPFLSDFSDGELHPAGDLLTMAIREDLTAVDQLIGWISKPVIERLVSEVQGADSPNFPFLTTGEFYKLKTTDNEELISAYVDAETEDRRREVLVDLKLFPLPTLEEAGEIVEPTRVEEVEWRASADEMVALLRRIETAMDADETGTLRAALNEVSPQNQEMGIWTFVFHVSGGEPGVFADAYLLERLDGVRFRFAIIAEDPNEEIDFTYFGGLSGTFVTLMAIDP